MKSPMRDSFTHKFLIMLFASLCASGLVYAYRHVVVSAIRSTSDAGWLEEDKARAKAKGR
jgi:hypothetical protein